MSLTSFGPIDVICNEIFIFQQVQNTAPNITSCQRMLLSASQGKQKQCPEAIASAKQLSFYICNKNKISNFNIYNYHQDKNHWFKGLNVEETQ